MARRDLLTRMGDTETLVTLAARHRDALDGLVAMAVVVVEGLSAAERESHTGRLFCGLAALIDQQRESAAGLQTLAEDAADAPEAPPDRAAGPPRDDRTVAARVSP